MAKLDAKPAPGDWSFTGGMDSFERHEKQLAALGEKSDSLTEDQIRNGEVAGGIVKFPIADGYALYLVSRVSPLTLQHIPFGDAWRIPSAHLRGLRLADIQAQLLGELSLRKLFAKSGK